MIESASKVQFRAYSSQFSNQNKVIKLSSYRQISKCARFCAAEVLNFELKFSSKFAIVIFNSLQDPVVAESFLFSWAWLFTFKGDYSILTVCVSLSVFSAQWSDLMSQVEWLIEKWDKEEFPGNSKTEETSACAVNKTSSLSADFPPHNFHMWWWVICFIVLIGYGWSRSRWWNVWRRQIRLELLSCWPLSGHSDANFSRFYRYHMPIISVQRATNFLITLCYDRIESCWKISKIDFPLFDFENLVNFRLKHVTAEKFIELVMRKSYFLCP